jgi:hypothetical protein
VFIRHAAVRYRESPLFREGAPGGTPPAAPAHPPFATPGAAPDEEGDGGPASRGAE